MTADEKKRVVKAWIALQNAMSKTQKDRHSWAHSHMWNIVRDDPDLAWEIILAILDEDSRDKVIENLAAGPLEELLGTHGEAVIERVELHARQRPEFRHLLGGVWQNSMPDTIWAKVQKAAVTRW